MVNLGRRVQLWHHQPQQPRDVGQPSYLVEGAQHILWQNQMVRDRVSMGEAVGGLEGGRGVCGSGGLGLAFNQCARVTAGLWVWSEAPAQSCSRVVAGCGQAAGSMRRLLLRSPTRSDSPVGCNQGG
jgi:hypothetical protein